MNRRVAIMFGGGGALGAFGCGVWKSLSTHLQGAEIIGAAGTSIGAVNAAFVAKHGDQLEAGANAMESTWRRDLATPSLPFMGAPMRRIAQSWNGLITGMLVGTRGMSVPNYANWTPVADMQRLNRPLMDRSQMWALLASRLGSFRADGTDSPLLGAAAVDVMSGKLRLFDSSQESVDVKHLSASSAIPMMYEPVSIDDRLYWDGDVVRQSALPLFLEALRRSGRLSNKRRAGTETVLVTIDLMCEEASRLPSSGVEVAYRMMELMTHGKMTVPTELLEGFDRHIAIRRRSLAHDAVSGQLDFSPVRIDELIKLGMEQADEAWAEMGAIPLTLRRA